MLYDLILYLPCFACLFWIVTMCLVSDKTSTFLPTLYILGIGGIFILASASALTFNSSPNVLLVCSILRVITAPSLIPLCWLYMLRLRGHGEYRLPELIWMLFPATLGGATIVLSILAGPDSIRESMPLFYSGAAIPADKTISTYFFVTGPVNYGIIAFEVLIYGFLFFRLMRKGNLRFSHLYKFERGYRLRVSELQAYYLFILCTIFLITIFIPRMVMINTPWVPAALSLLLTAAFYQFGYTSLFNAREAISKKELRRGFLYNYSAATKSESLRNTLSDILEEADTETLRELFTQIGVKLPAEELHPAESRPDGAKSPAAQIFSAVAKSWDDDSLLSRFERLIFGKQLFLEPGLTLVDVAEKLHTNKTYVSRLVNNTYEMPFPDLVNTLRVDYAEQYIVAHPDARQNEIAQACGFSSASSFNNIFKKVTGVTPKIWLATNENSQK